MWRLGPGLEGQLLPGAVVPGAVLPGAVVPGAVLPGAVVPEAERPVTAARQYRLEYSANLHCLAVQLVVVQMAVSWAAP